MALTWIRLHWLCKTHNWTLYTAPLSLKVSQAVSLIPHLTTPNPVIQHPQPRTSTGSCDEAKFIFTEPLAQMLKENTCQALVSDDQLSATSPLRVKNSTGPACPSIRLSPFLFFFNYPPQPDPPIPFY